MLKIYAINGRKYQFEEGKQPEGAVEVIRTVEPSEKAAEPKNKAVKPANKARKAGVK